MDKNLAKCNMGFASDTVTEKMLRAAEKMKLDKNKVKSNVGFTAYNSNLPVFFFVFLILFCVLFVVVEGV